MQVRNWTQGIAYNALLGVLIYPTWRINGYALGSESVDSTGRMPS